MTDESGQPHREVDSGPSDVDLLELHDALERLAREEPFKSEVVELRFFGGLSIEETAEALGISTGSVKRHWIAARAWLYRELYGDAARPLARTPPTTAERDTTES